MSGVDSAHLPVPSKHCRLGVALRAKHHHILPTLMSGWPSTPRDVGYRSLTGRMATDDFLHDLSPFSQSVQLAEELERRDHPHEIYFYEGLRHYFSTSADNATTQQMFQDSLDCLRRWLESE